MDHQAAGASSWFIGSSTNLVQPMARPGTGYNRFAMENRLPRICWTSLSHWNMLILEILRVYDEHHFWRQPPKPSGHQCQGTERKAVNMALMSICSSGKNLLDARGLEKTGKHGETVGKIYRWIITLPMYEQRKIGFTYPIFQKHPNMLRWVQ